MSAAWKVSRDDGAVVYVRAPTAERALAAGKYWMRVVGFKRRSRNNNYSVVPFRPERDSDLRRFVRAKEVA